MIKKAASTTPAQAATHRVATKKPSRPGAGVPTPPIPAGSAAPSGAAPRERRQRVQSAQTGMAVLKGLARLGGRASLSNLAGYVSESPAKVHRYLVSLIEEGLVVQDSATQQYLLGAEAMMIGVAAMRQADPVRAAEPALVRLREALEVTSFVAVMGNMGPTIVRFEEPGLPVTVNVRVGSVMSLLWSSTGRVFLGLLDDSRVLALAQEEFRHAAPALRALLEADEARDGTDNETLSHAGAPVNSLRRAVQAEVEAHRCASVKDTNLKGISAVSAPLFDHTGRLCAVLTALGATGGFDASPEGPVADALRREAAAASALLGYAPPATRAA
ncbi:IclR family transcriptional regulator [Paraburkholderia silviterrae]|uniref:IclR family transcriptional regulator n=1 Tax=Paraburkholderia silviterrae TaxID=2528715 RepID=A0A4R5MEF7_9BURK|nr:helix-turn-helix domain-containing protein [Paraburkholderia silviterrae]TDG25153.1 IclR family transcriptional regulator [Paraburkholderia silviterrae]